MRILVIEEHEAIFEGLQSHFNRKCKKSTLSWARNTNEAFKRLKEEKIDWLVSELDFTDMDGAEHLEDLVERDGRFEGSC